MIGFPWMGFFMPNECKSHASRACLALTPKCDLCHNSTGISSGVIKASVCENGQLIFPGMADKDLLNVGLLMQTCLDCGRRIRVVDYSEHLKICSRSQLLAVSTE